jgi:hypothetical protein
MASEYNLKLSQVVFASRIATAFSGSDSPDLLTVLRPIKTITEFYSIKLTLE